MKNPCSMFLNGKTTELGRGCLPEHFPFPVQIHYSIWHDKTPCSFLTALMMPKSSQNE